jgi:hypothetical protein
MVWFGHLTLKMTGPSPDLTCRKAEFWAGSEEPGQNDVTMIVLFPPRKAFGFFFKKILWNWFHSLSMLRIVRGGAGGGYDGKLGFWLRAAERDIRTNRPGRTTRSADHTL